MNLDALLPISSSMRVLFADDEKEFREITSFFLADIFKHVDVVENGSEALVLYETNPTSYDMVITDLSMPILDGIGLIKKIQQLNPHKPF